MKAPLSWLKEYLPLSQTPEELSDIFTLAGLEVEGITPCMADFSGVVSAKIEEVKPHPNASKLQIATLFDGTERFQVVCGGKNCRAGLVTAFAKVGAKLKLSSDPIHIEKASLRGVDSYGMLCGEDELGLVEKSDGIMELSSDFPLGISLESLVEDTILDISLTPNLGHCLSMLGLARELKAHLKAPLDFPQVHFQESASSKISDFVQVSVEQSDDCRQYSCRLIYGLQSTVTPWFIKSALQKAGIRSKHLVVDVLNYVMLECGQPMHAFDYNKLPSKKLSARQLPHAQDFTTLDGLTRKVPKGTLMIFDGETPVAIAGIMGGNDTAVVETSKMILIEAAHFSPSLIRKGMKTLQLRSESSNRFEKGIDQLGIELALDRAVSLIQHYGKCEIASSIHTVIAKPYEEKKISCHYHNISRILGIEFSKNEVEEYLRRLDITVRFHGDDSYHVTIPSYRNDIELEIDVIEELARIYGYNHIPMRNPVYSSSIIPHHPMFAFQKKLRSILLSQGLQELLGCDLISPQEAEIGLRHTNQNDELISVMHAKSIDQSVLRSTFIPGFLSCIDYNNNYGQYTMSGFEIGRLHFKDGFQFSEKLALGIVLTGMAQPDHYSTKSPEVDFLDLKGILENLLESIHVENVKFSKTSIPVFHPGRQAELKVENSLIGVVGQIHPSVENNKGLRYPIYYAQIDSRESNLINHL